MSLYKVKKSKIDNQGVYAAKDIKAGTRIIYYKGKLITKKETERNPKYDNDKAIYLFNINNRYDLDGDFKYNTARLINHSCEPNCEVDGKGLKLWIFSLRNIKKVTKITPKFSTTGGTSDARFIRKIAPCLEFGLVNKTMHKVDECVSLSDLKNLTKIYHDILEEYFK